MHRLAIIVMAISLGTCLAQDVGKDVGKDAGKPEGTFTLDDVLKLVHAPGITEDVVIAKIKRYNRPFDLNSDEIIELQKSGVSGAIIKYLLEPTLPYAPTPPAPPEVKPPVVPLKDPLMPKIPPEPGLYWLSSPEPDAPSFEFIEIKPVVPLKSKDKKIGKLLTIKKGHTVGFLVSAESKLRVGSGPLIFYARLGPKIAIEDIILLQMVKGDGRRLLNFGPKPDKPVFPPDAIRSFDSKLLSEGLYRLNVEPIKPGEYLFLILGSGDDKKGILGKGYDFGAGPPGK